MTDILYYLNYPFLSLSGMFLSVVLFYLLNKFVKAFRNQYLGYTYDTYLSTGDWDKAKSVLVEGGKALLIANPSCTTVTGLGSSFEQVMIEFSHGYSCNYTDVDKYDGEVNPLFVGIACNREQAEALSVGLTTFLKLNAEHSKKVKVSEDGKVINIENLLNNPEKK